MALIEVQAEQLENLTDEKLQELVYQMELTNYHHMRDTSPGGQAYDAALREIERRESL